jgi:heat shock protein HslJ
VAFLREAECSDGMSDDTHPVVARVSLPGGRFLAGCCRILARAPAADAAGAPTLEGPVWRLTELRGQDPKTLAALSPGVTLRFEAGRLQAFGGCNRFAGSYTREGELVRAGPLAGTLMACPEPQMAVEAAVRSALAGALRPSLTGERLTLTREADAEPSLVFEMAPPPRLEGITWEVTGFNNGRQAVVSPVPGTALSVLFQDGSVTGHAGCNSFRASYTREGDRLAIGPAAATRMHCEGEGVMEQERQFLAALETATRWALDRDMLDVHRADGERVLFARPVQD